MRLLRCDSEQLLLQTFNEDSKIPKYAILSHTWLAAEDEVTYSDLNDFDASQRKPGWSKLDYARRQARYDGYLFVWIDTCCIDKSSSAELAEAINSMFRWYQEAEICYVYLTDVQPLNDPNIFAKIGQTATVSGDLRNSRWFTRGWTLQELLAPPKLHFYGLEWQSLGSWDRGLQTYYGAALADASNDCEGKLGPQIRSKMQDHISFAGTISDITGIHRDVLLGRSDPRSHSIAQRMSWAADRETTRAEDRAYSLLGMFDINMPVIYGEGSRAFQRLQQEILRIDSDQSIFAWNHHSSDSRLPRDQSVLLAPSPVCFRESSNIIPLAYKKTRSYELTGAGVRITLPVMYKQGDRTLQRSVVVRGVLHCTVEDDRTKAVVLNLIRTNEKSLDFLVHHHKRFKTIDIYKTLSASTEQVIDILNRPKATITRHLGAIGRIILFRCIDSEKTLGSRLSIAAAEPLQHWREHSQSFHIPAGEALAGHIQLQIAGDVRVILIVYHGRRDSGGLRKLGVDAVMELIKPGEDPSARFQQKQRQSYEAQLSSHLQLHDGLSCTAEMSEHFLNDQWATLITAKLSRDSSPGGSSAAPSVPGLSHIEES